MSSDVRSRFPESEAFLEVPFCSTINIYLSIMTDVDRQVLIELYRSTDGENWKNKSNWCTELPLYEWHGVKVIYDHVISLDLNGNGLRGT